MEPKIRFIGHKLNWSVVALDKVTTARNASNALVNNRNLLSLSYGKIVNKDIDSNKGLLPSSFSTYQIIEPNTIVFRGTDLQNDKRSLRVAISKQKGIISPAYVTMDVTDENILPYYLYLAMHWHDVSKKSYYKMGDGLRQTLPYSVLKELEIPFPDKSEQQEIIAYFRKLDAKLQASAKKVESLKKLKSASLVAMFPQNGESMPKVRFKGFEGEWDKQSASDLFLTIDERNRPELPVLSACQDVRGMIPRDKIGFNVSHDTSNEVTYKRIQPGQFVIHLRSFQGGFAHSSYDGIISPAYTVFDFKNKEQHDDYYWKIVFMSRSFIERLRLITYGIRDGRSISFNEFKELSFLFPSKEEQQAIASFFRSLDCKIALETARLEKLKQIKLACLDKMFV